VKASHDLKGLIKFLDRDEWREEFQSVLDEHFGPVLDEVELEFEELGDILDDQWLMILWGCAFEDFLTQELDGGRNLVDEYIKRRGWKEGAQTKAYMKALRTSIMSLYEASEIMPGKSFLARDILRGGDPILVSEGTATQTLVQWEKIAARIIKVGDRHILAGGLLPFSPEVAEMLVEGLRDTIGKKRSRAKLILGDESLRVAAPLFTNVWLFDTVLKALGQHVPDIRNSEGEEIVFHEVRFPLAKGTTRKNIAARLGSLSELSQANDQSWNWLDCGPKKRARRKGTKANGQSWQVTMDDGVPVLGNVELKGRTLRLMVNSASRAKKGTELLAQALGDLAGQPLTSIQTLEQFLDSGSADPEPPEMDLPPELQATIIHEMLDRQYRAMLDEPVGMLGNKTPRKAATTMAGREKVAEWLKYMEHHSARASDPADPMATYDFGWLWRELKVEDLRR
jgi:hypothetical protein